jgi:hypothetical protein
MARRLMVWTLMAIVLLGALPLLSFALGLSFASAFGCSVDEASVNPCVVLGLDFGGLLSLMTLGGFFSSMVAMPLAALLLVVWLIVLIVLLLLRRRRGAAAL